MPHKNRLSLLRLTAVLSLILLINQSVSISANSANSTIQEWNEPKAQSANTNSLYQWHTYYGELLNIDYSHLSPKIATDSFGNIYISGSSSNAWLGPNGENPNHTSMGGIDIFILKLAPDGSYLGHTFYGGVNDDLGCDLVIDSQGNVLIVGRGLRWNLDGTYDPAYSTNAFSVLKLNSNLEYQWHTFLGNNSQFESAIAIDGSDNIYLTGSSGDWAGPGGEEPIHDFLGTYYDIVVIKISSSGSYQYHTFYGSSDSDIGVDIAIDQNGVYVTGESSGLWLGDEAAEPLHSGGSYNFSILKLDLDLGYIWHTFYGEYLGNSAGIALDNSGSILVTGFSFYYWAGDNNAAPLNEFSGAVDIHILKLSMDGDYLWHTFYGSASSGDVPKAIVVDDLDRVYVSGKVERSWDGDYGSAPIHQVNGYNPFVVLCLSAGGRYLWHTFYGIDNNTSQVNEATGITFFENTLYITGLSSNQWLGDSGQEPLRPHSGSLDMFTLRLDPLNVLAVTGHVTWEGGAAEEGVRVTANKGLPSTIVGEATTDNEGYYHLVVQGLFDYIKPVKDGLTFFPGQENIRVCLNCISGDFTIPQPFLDFPLDYDNFSLAILGNTNNGPGKVNSWFDHYYPNYGPENYQVKTWGDNFFRQSDPCWNELGKGVCWYDEHDGIDFTGDYGAPVYSAGAGTVVKIYNQCGEGVLGNPCGYNQNYLGNQIWIDHGNGYLTVYGHLLKDSILVSVGSWLSGRVQIAGMGNSGSSSGRHLHFAVYHDKNNNADWPHATSLDEEEVVDPYGWQSYGKDRYGESDPWEASNQSTSRWMWKYPAMNTVIADESGGIYFSPSGYKTISIPPGALGSGVELQILDETPTRRLLQGYQSTGQAFWLRVPDLGLMQQNESDDFAVPITLTVQYEEMAVAHIDKSKLKLLHFDESTQSWEILETSLYSSMYQAQAKSIQAGHFDLQGPLLCPSDNFEPDDTSAGATLVNNGGKVSWFDTAMDEDWFRFNANSGVNYTIDVLPTTPEVKPIIELYAGNGETLLETSTNIEGKEILKWKAESHGIYYVRIRQSAGSAYGCDAGILANLAAEISIWLPLVRK